MGVDVRVISGDDPDTVATLARQAGLDVSRGVVSGPELEAMDEARFRLAAERTAIFGRITPELKERLVGTFRDQGHYVAMTGDGVNDVLSLKRSNLAIAMGSGSQATRGVADLILIDDGFAALASAIGEGQRILNGMQDILRVFLTRILSLGMLIVSALVIGFFPVDLRNASVITLFTVGIPTALLAVWARPGRQPRETLQQTLARFVVPPAAVASFLGLLVVTVVLLFAEADYDAGLIPTRERRAHRPHGRDGLPRLRRAPARRLRGAAAPLAGGHRAGLAGPPADLAGHRPGHRLPRSSSSCRRSASSSTSTPWACGRSLVVLVALAGWAALVWISWRGRFVDRFLGIAPPQPISTLPDSATEAPSAAEAAATTD